MKNKTNAAVALGSILAVVLGVTMWSPAVSQPADPKPGMAMMEGCQDMMDQKKQMAADTKKEHAELTAHAVKMNAAPAEQKVEVMAALLTHVIEQRASADKRMAIMEETKMRHMMEHMAMCKDSKATCPMVEGMKGMDGMEGGMGSMKSGSADDMVKGMRDMNAAMAAELRNSGSKHDEEFINMMLEHHKGAVLMGEVALEKSRKQEIRQLSSEIITAQTKEIELLYTWRKEWYGY